MTKRIKMQGLIVGDFHGDKELMHEFRTNMAQYVQEGKVKVREHLTEGIENAGTAFIEVGGGRGGHMAVKGALQLRLAAKHGW